jgi:Na+/proline symporter
LKGKGLTTGSKFQEEAIRMSAILIILSFGLSMIAVGYLFKKKNNKRISILLALILNTLFLGIAFGVLYTEEMRIFGAGIEKILILVLAIPLVTWVNALALQFIKPKNPQL